MTPDRLRGRVGSYRHHDSNRAIGSSTMNQFIHSESFGNRATQSQMPGENFHNLNKHINLRRQLL